MSGHHPSYGSDPSISLGHWLLGWGIEGGFSQARYLDGVQVSQAFKPTATDLIEPVVMDYPSR